MFSARIAAIATFAAVALHGCGDDDKNTPAPASPSPSPEPTPVDDNDTPLKATLLGKGSMEGVTGSAVLGSLGGNVHLMELIVGTAEATKIVDCEDCKVRIYEGTCDSVGTMVDEAKWKHAVNFEAEKKFDKDIELEVDVDLKDLSGKVIVVDSAAGALSADYFCGELTNVMVRDKAFQLVAEIPEDGNNLAGTVNVRAEAETDTSLVLNFDLSNPDADCTFANKANLASPQCEITVYNLPCGSTNPEPTAEATVSYFVADTKATGVVSITTALTKADLLGKGVKISGTTTADECVNLADAGLLLAV